MTSHREGAEGRKNTACTHAHRSHFPVLEALGKELPRSPPRDPQAHSYRLDVIKTQQFGAGEKAKAWGQVCSHICFYHHGLTISCRRNSQLPGPCLATQRHHTQARPWQLPDIRDTPAKSAHGDQQAVPSLPAAPSWGCVPLGIHSNQVPALTCPRKKAHRQKRQAVLLTEGGI